MIFARSFLLFSYGLFTIAAQTLLFREFITTFEGHDITVSLFFASWFLWIGIGAVVVYKVEKIAERLLQNIEFLFLVYIPAFVLQLVLISQAREIAGIKSYAFLSIQSIVLLSILVNAPVSFVTGAFFPIACRWVEQDRKLPVSHVYIIEAAGSFFGGLCATIFLSLGVNSITIFFALAFVILLSVLTVQLAKIRILKQYHTISILFVSLISLSVLICFALGVDKTLHRYMQTVKWQKLLPKEAFAGSFQTAQAEYFYGSYYGQWVVVCEGSACETLPDKSVTGRIAAIVLSQNPAAKKILVIGSGLGLCYEFINLSQIERVTWAYSDSEYIQQVDKFLPQQFKLTDSRLIRLTGDIRSQLVKEKQYYDIAIINLPDAASSVLNRYFTLEFYQQIKNSLSPKGLLAVRVTGGENIMGTELINLGASTKLTLEKIFSHLVLVPGDDTWFIASDSENLTGTVGTLAEAFAKIPDAQKVFTPQALLSIYLPDRAALALQSYAAADLPNRLLINHDSNPLAYLYSLLLMAKQSGSPAAKFVKHLVLAGPLTFLIPILVFVILRFVYILRTSSRSVTSGFDSSFLIFSAGWLGSGAVIILMYLYQTCFGSLYLHIGIISSIFMIGLAAGAALIRLLLVRPIVLPLHKTHGLSVTVIFIHVIVFAAIAYWPLGKWTHSFFAFVFFLCGICTGAYLPLAAKQLADGGLKTTLVGGKLELADHIGASAGGLLTGLVLVPVLGITGALLVLIFLILANIPAALLRIYKPEKLPSLAESIFNFRRLGYILFGIAASVIICSNLLTIADIALKPSLPKYAAQSLVGQAYLERVSIVSPQKVSYFKVYKTKAKDNLTGYVFSSQDLTPDVRGFGGSMNLAVYVNTRGELIDFNILRSNETPSYLELLSRWRDSLKQRKLFQPEPFIGIDAVTGATVSSKAVLSAMELSSHKFVSDVLEQEVTGSANKQSRWVTYLPDRSGCYLIAAVVLTLIAIYHGQFWSRLAVLVFNLIVGGILLNVQYSTEQIVTLLSVQMPDLVLTGTFLLTVGIPLLVIFFGNIYCGFICPFGAAQELVGYIIPSRFKPLPIEGMRKARFIKYLMLFTLMLFFFISRSRETLASDPLIEVFNFRFSNFSFQPIIYTTVVIALTCSLFYNRFWCRYLCPAGAFLSLFNKFVLLKRYLKPKKFAKCEFGLGGKDNLDCIYCYRCYHVPGTDLAVMNSKPAYPYVIPLSKYFVSLVLAVAMIASFVSANKFLDSFSVANEYSAPSISSAGQPRDVNLEQIHKMIKEKRLSDREAEFYKKGE
jgi:predicted membrane-bound spermidine synthase/Na+-translocating ferredoxin:NAD+ oxidoreductase RnfG subunit